MKKIASYGTWQSPITAELIAQGSSAILNLLIDGDDTYWCESRPTNKGRYTLVKRDKSGNLTDITPPEFNARTFVHEYGGGAFTVHQGIVYTSSAGDSAIYVFKEGASPKKLTQGQTSTKSADKIQWQGVRFADLRFTPHGLVAVAEEHAPNTTAENFLALIDCQTGAHKKITSGYDFYASPAISPDGKKIAWLCWNHPNMPWTHTELWVADFAKDATIKNPQRVAGDLQESILQPQWSKEGILYFIADRDKGWWNIHRLLNGKIENICPIDAEVGDPLWIFDKSAYTFLNDKIFFSYNREGIIQLAVLDIKTKNLEPIRRDGVTIQHLRSGPNYIQFLEGYPNKDDAIVQINDTPPHYTSKTLYGKSHNLNEEYLSPAQHISFPSNGRTAYGFYFPPRNPLFKAPQNEKPPLIISIHGGPTAQARGSFQLRHQFWTSRGFALLDVNYGGSTGYGREYRNLLNRNWGVIDVEDCINGALYLVKEGLADPQKLVIRGGSAGGYTTLAALATSNVFKAGANYFGVADITALAKDTHKFESRYMDELIGKYPEEKALWDSRSPINAVHNIKSPLIIFQGEDDPVVPKNQSIMIYEALKKSGIQTELHLYPGEQHGFRQPDNIAHSLNCEAKFYLDVFGLTSPL